ncbi:MAG: TetR/AcrR family transcriptional regulator, partial [Verrucomicrobiota bacterium]
NLFWRKGYSDTSMADLLDVTALTKGSFYNAFGSKRDLFIQALTRYEQDTRVMLQELSALDSPSTAIQTFFEGLIASTTSDTDKKGCFTVNMLLCITSYDEEIQSIVRRTAQSVETFFKQMIELGRVRGEISEDVSPEKNAKLLFSTMVSIRVLGRGTYDTKSLEILAERALRLIK